MSSICGPRRGNDPDHCSGILLAVFIMNMLRLLPYVIVLLLIAWAVGSLSGWKRRRENPSLTEAAGSSGCAGVKLRQQMAFARSRQGSRDEGRGTLWAGSLCGSD
jgi:hypothetical protein